MWNEFPKICEWLMFGCRECKGCEVRIPLLSPRISLLDLFGLEENGCVANSSTELICSRLPRAFWLHLR